MKLFRILSALIFFCDVALSEPVRGPSFIGICNPNFPCRAALSILDGQKEKALGYLSDAFGHECSCVSEFLKLAGKKYVRVHLANGTCFPERGRRCGRYDVFYKENIRTTEAKLLKRDAKLLRRYRASITRTKALLGEAGDSLRIRYSLCLECPISDKARRVLLKEALRHLPQEAIVDSPIKFKCLSGVICEKHGDDMRYDRGQRCISDTDGISAFEGNLQRLNRNSKQCEAIFYWSYGFNLLPYGYKGEFIPPYMRKKTAEDLELEGVRMCIKQ